jgi:hypothetical protein
MEEDKTTLNKSFDDNFYKRTFSPTPTPRRKMMTNNQLINFYLNQTSDSNSEKNENDKLLNDQSSITSESTTTNSSLSSRYVSSTMPIPRKPRKRSLDCKEKIEKDKNFELNNTIKTTITTLSSTKQELLPYDTTYYLNNLVYGFENYANSFSSSNSNSFQSYISKQTNLTLNETSATLELGERFMRKNTSTYNTLNKLKRPTAPPPPLPKTPPPLIPPPSPTQFLVINESIPRMTSTPHFTTKSQSNHLLTTAYLNDTNNKDNHNRIQNLNTHLNQNHLFTKNTLKQKILAASRKNHFSSRRPLGFEHLNSKSSSSSKSTNYIFDKIEKNLKLDLVVSLFGVILFLICICFIIVFQAQVHQFYSKFLNLNQTNSTMMKKDELYYTAGSNLVKQTILICNGPYFSYQMNNLLVLPFSLTLVIIFSFFSKREKGCIRTKNKRNRLISEMSRRPGLPSHLNPFQRQNRFLVAALFCILANEIFKMIESSMFAPSNSLQSVNTTIDNFFFMNSNVSNFLSKQSNKFLRKSSKSDFFRIGLGLEPNLYENSVIEKISTTKSTTTATTSKPVFILAPSILRYSKPKLPPKLNDLDIEEETTTTTTPLTTINEQILLYRMLNQSYNPDDLNLTLTFSEKLNKLRQAKNQTGLILQSFNQSLNGSSSKTLFEVSMSLYQNEHIQNVMNKLFQSQLKWSLITDKLEKLGFMMLEVMMIGMRYYPLLGILDKNSLVCLFLATIYMWGDIAYNITLIGLCEGLRFNINLDLLKDIRRILGVGFIDDAKSYLNKNLNSKTSNNIDYFDQIPIDANLLFSTNRIIYTIIKSLPHFFCLSYVTIRLTAAFFVLFRKKFNKYFFVFPICNQNKSLNTETMDKSYAYYEKNLIIDSKLSKDYNLIYTKKNLASKISNIYSKIVVQKQDDRQTYLFKKYPLSFEDRYVKNLFKNDDDCQKKYSHNKFRILLNYVTKHFGWFKDESFRFSTRMVCTYTVCFTVLYYLTCFVIFYGGIFVDMIYLPPIYKQSIITSTIFTSIICLIQLILSMKQFKIHLKSLYKGTSNNYLSPKSFYSNKKIATNSFNYAGYAVTYTCWGYIILLILLTFFSFQIATLIYFGSGNIALFVLVILIPFTISVLIIKLINRFICSLAAKFCFLQKRSRVLALKNLKLYSLFIYFKFFYDCFAGLAFCMIRMIISIILSIVFLPRLDYSFMGRSMEKMDNAFMSYVGYLHWEAHHTNPIAICFCNLLKRFSKLKMKFKLNKSDMIKNRIRNKWYLFCLLAKNKQLIKYRKHNLKQK